MHSPCLPDVSRFQTAWGISTVIGSSIRLLWVRLCNPREFKEITRSVSRRDLNVNQFSILLQFFVKLIANASHSALAKSINESLLSFRNHSHFMTGKVQVDFLCWQVISFFNLFSTCSHRRKCILYFGLCFLQVSGSFWVKWLSKPPA